MIRCFALYLILGILLPLSAHASGEQTCTFSSVKVIPEVDDLVGDEVSFTILPRGTTVRGRWLLYEGFEPACVELVGALRNGRLRLRSENAPSALSLDAKITDTKLQGTLTWKVNGRSQTRGITLQRVAAPPSGKSVSVSCPVN